MKKQTFAELATADERTQRFTPYGLSMGTRILTPESSADFQQGTIATADLDSSVPKSTQAGFERLRLLHAYGVLCYELFTVTDDLTWIVLEHALRERFVTFYGGQIPVVDKNGTRTSLAASDFRTISAAFRRGGSHSKGWKLDLSPDPAIPMPLTLEPLLRWAHRVGLLSGQRNRRVQLAVYAEIRNHFAHGAGVDRLGSPPDSSRAIRDVAEVINRLWGVRTPGGRLYPAPIARHPVILAWTKGWGTGEVGSMFTEVRLHHLDNPQERDLTGMVVLAPEAQDDLVEFDARYELTSLPTDWLFGPAPFDEAAAWLRSNTDVRDAVDALDRIFAVRVSGGKVFLPMRPEVFKAVPVPGRSGTWHLVRADYPNDAIAHVRHQAQGAACPDDRYSGCPITDVADGTWDAMVAEVDRLIPDLRVAPWVTAAVPRHHLVPDDVGYQ